MKTISTFLTALCALVTFYATAQTVNQDTAWGGQMKYYTKAIVIIPADSAVMLRNIWGFNSTFNPFSEGITWDTLTNTTSVADTIQLFDSVPMTTTGTFITKWEFQSLGDTASHFTVPMPVTIKNVIERPMIEINTSNPTTNGGLITFDYHAGYDLTTVKILLSLGDTTFSNPTLQNSSMTVIDSGTGSWSLTGYPAGYTVSFKLIGKNSFGSDTTRKGWIKVLPSNSLWISQVDSFGSTDNTITARAQVICNGTQTVRKHIALHNQSSFYYEDETITGTGIAMALYFTVTGLNSSTDYDVWYEYVGTSTTGPKRLISTIAPIYEFDATTDTVLTAQVTNVRVSGTIVVPSGTAQVGAMRAAASDLNFTVALDASPLVTYGQGVHTFTYDFENVPAGTAFRYKVYGYSSTGDYVDGNSLVYTLIVVGDTTKPVITLFDTTNVTTTTVEVVFTGTDTVGVTNFVLTKNGTVVATVLNSQSAYTYTNLTAATTYTLGIQAKDDAGNYSLLQTILVTTDATATVPTQATLTSITDKVCFDGNGTWGLVTIYGTNIQPGANYSGEYYDGQLPDQDSVMNVNATHTQCDVWVWVGAHFPQVTFTVTNPGAGVSNAITTKVDDCVATGVNEVARTDRKELSVFPNPVIDVTTIKIGQVSKDKGVDYQIFGLTGNLASTGTFFSTENTVNLQQLPAGIYILKTSTGLSKKIVKL